MVDVLGHVRPPAATGSPQGCAAGQGDAPGEAGPCWPGAVSPWREAPAVFPTGKHRTGP